MTNVLERAKRAMFPKKIEVVLGIRMSDPQRAANAVLSVQMVLNHRSNADRFTNLTRRAKNGEALVRVAVRNHDRSVDESDVRDLVAEHPTVLRIA